MIVDGCFVSFVLALNIVKCLSKTSLQSKHSVVSVFIKFKKLIKINSSFFIILNYQPIRLLYSAWVKLNHEVLSQLQLLVIHLAIGGPHLVHTWWQRHSTQPSRDAIVALGHVILQPEIIWDFSNRNEEEKCGLFNGFSPLSDSPGTPTDFPYKDFIFSSCSLGRTGASRVDPCLAPD